MKHPKVIALIGARAGSKRIPKKNTKLLGGRPLIYYTISIAKTLGVPCYLSSDSSEILSVGQELGVSPCLRSERTAQDDSTDAEWIREFLEQYKTSRELPDAILFLRPTTPFRCLEKVKSAVKLFDSRNTSLRSVEKLSEAVEKTFKIRDNLLSPMHDRMTLEITNFPNDFFEASYRGNGYVDILKPEVVLESKDIYGKKIQAFETPRTIELDTIEEWMYAEYLIKNQRKVKIVPNYL